MNIRLFAGKSLLGLCNMEWSKEDLVVLNQFVEFRSQVRQIGLKVSKNQITESEGRRQLLDLLDNPRYIPTKKFFTLKPDSP